MNVKNNIAPWLNDTLDNNSAQRRGSSLNFGELLLEISYSISENDDILRKSPEFADNLSQ